MLYVFGDYTLDSEQYELRQAGGLVPLEPRVFDLLAYLIQHSGRTVPTEELLAQLYPNEFAPVERLTNAVAQARKVLGDTGQTQRYIQTVRRRGYRFRVPVTPQPPGPAPPAPPGWPGPGEPVEQAPAHVVSSPPPVPLDPSPALPPAEPTASALLSTGPGLSQAERRQLTVLVCRLVAVAARAEPLDPEELLEVVRAYHALCAEVVRQYAGHIAQSQGERLVVYFGYPQAHEDDARRAVHTGLSLVAGMAELRRRLQRVRGVRLAVQAGIHTGIVVVGALGHDARELFALGNTPTIAAQIQGLAAPDTVVISSATRRLIEGYFEAQVLGTYMLDDPSEPLAVYQIRQGWITQSRFAVAVTQGLTPLVGREQELGLLRERWTQVQDGLGQVVVLSGEAGIGKSRLVQALKESLPREAHTRIECSCSPYYQQSAFYPVVEHVQRLLQFRQDDSPEEKLHKLEAALGHYDFALGEVVPLFAALLSLPLAERYAPLRLTPERQKQKTLEALLAWLLQEAERQPVCCIMEDLHWIDPSTLEWLNLLIDQLPTARVLLLLLFRPDFHPPWAMRSHFTHLTLTRLSSRQTAGMIRQVVGDKPLPDEVIQQLVATTDGVPLFVEELTKMVLESGLVKAQEGRYVLTGPLAPLAIPATLHDALLARLDRLGQAKQVAQLGAVVGREFAYEMLRAVTPVEEAPLQERLAQLVEAELLYQRGLPPQARYRFKHILIQEVAYQSLLVRRRQDLHGAIGQAIEELYADRLAEQAAILAYHYARSQHRDKAVTYALLAGDRAAHLYANAEATVYYEQALTIARALPPSPTTQGVQIDAMVKLAAVSLTRQDMDRDQQNLGHARLLAETLRDDLRLAQVLYWLGRLRYALGDFEAALTFTSQSLALADRLGNEALAAPLVHLIGRLYLLQQSDYVRASQMLERSVALMRRFGNKNEEATAVGFAGLAFGFMGEFAQAFPYLDQGIRLAEELQNPFAEAAAYHYRGFVHGQQGAWSQAITDYQAARRLAEHAGDPFRVYLVQFYEGLAYAMIGEPDQGRLLIEESIGLASQLGTAFLLPWAKAYLATCLRKLGAADAALAPCDEAIRLAADTHDKYASAIAHRTLAEVVLCTTPPDLQQAERAIREAIRLQQEIVDRPGLARSYVSYARLLQAQGQQEQAAASLARAIDMFQQMRMIWDVAAAEQRRREG